MQEFKHINEAEMLALIESGIRQPMIGHLVTGLDSYLDIATMEKEGNMPFFTRDLVLRHLHYLRPHLKTETTMRSTNDEATPASLLLAAQLASALPTEQAEYYIQTAFINKLVA